MKIKVGNKIKEISLINKENNKVEILVDDKTYNLDIVMAENGLCSIITEDGHSYNAELKPTSNNNQNYTVSVAFNTFPVEIISPYQYGAKKAKSSEKQDKIFSPMPGKVVRILVKEGEIVKFDRLSGEIEFDWIESQVEREKAKTSGFVAYFRLLNGFEKSLYMTAEELEAHAKKYSKNYAKYGTGLWKDSFDDMAKKTVLKLLLSKFGPLNTQLERAIKEDQTVDGEYDDNPTRKPELTEEQEAEIVSDAEKLVEELESEDGD